ncbi:MAG: DNA (cytosine-5-)-methyltransferase [Flavobacteriaceae bacterium]
MEPLRVIELFAGVGGFRLGLEKMGNYKVVWSNQWEPSTKTQHASMVYEARFGQENHSNQDIAQVTIDAIPNADILVGGFPCQDYSVATTLQNSKGLIGKKGVLWWQIHRILAEKKNRPPYLFLENVDRLLKSPSTHRGRDFAIMLKSLGDLGYAVEWRVVNAADYGMPQRRRRVFILGYPKGSPLHNALKNETPKDWVLKTGTIAQAFPVKEVLLKKNQFSIKGSLIHLSKNFNKAQKLSPFYNSGFFWDGEVTTVETSPEFNGKQHVLEDFLQNGEVSREFFISKKDLPKWEYLKGAKKEIRKSKNGHEYHYSEGAMVFPDALDKPARTIITGEGGTSPSRFKHVVKTKRGLRRLTPIELERLNMFPDNHTELEGISDAKRAFFMGNALVVGIVEKIGEALCQKIRQYGP